jgi:hypothetical protein
MNQVRLSVTAAMSGMLALAWGCEASKTAEASAMAAAGQPIVSADVVFEEVDGVVAVEAEHYQRQSLDDIRRWYRFTPEHQPDIEPDGDPAHLAGASGGAYLEALPDTRRTHGDRLIRGENFSNQPGRMAVLTYRVKFNTPGRYYVWARIYSTTTEDNGLHVGIDGAWPASGQRMQWTAKHRWAWGSKQRTAEVHTGVPHQLYLDVEEPGEHRILFSMREDGTEFDKWMMTRERLEGVEGTGPATRLARGTLPAAYAMAQGEGKPDAAGSGAEWGLREGALIDPQADLLSLHYDHAPDRDDGQSAAADRTILQTIFDAAWIDDHVVAVSGAYGKNQARFNPNSNAVMDAVWGEGEWLAADEDWDRAVEQLADRWTATFRAGGDVWVKEGGQSDITADAMKRIRKRMPDLDLDARLHVVQHSDWNERQTTDADLAYVKEHAHYIRIRDANRYLNIRGGDEAFEQAATSHPTFGPWWEAAFDYYPPDQRLDFSDTGELMHLLGLGEMSIDAVRQQFLTRNGESGGHRNGNGDGDASHD